jgi:N6-L-threonylcarbamoyladenine synthase
MAVSKYCVKAVLLCKFAILTDVKILGIESSCDETAVAIVEDGRKLLSNVVQTQIDIHTQYGGVVPEVAARSHIEIINPVINQALADAGCTWDDIDAIAVTYAPGLIGSLLVGTLAARTLAIIHNKPLYPIHHVEAHVYANFIVEKATRASESEEPLATANTPARVADGGAAPAFAAPEVQAKEGADRLTGPESSDLRSEAYDGSGREKPTVRSISALDSLVLPSSQPTFPMLALIVSGGHSQLVLFHDHGDYELLGQTQDDAVGEAFDKVAKIIGLPYPGGPSIAKAAIDGDPHRYKLPKAKLANPYDFSFSGLKTALLRAVQAETGNDYRFPSHELAALLDDVTRNDFAASFQQIAVETLVDKAERAFRDYSPASVVIAGGVAANQELRRQLSERLPINIEYAPIQLCTDNGAMIATLGYYYAQKKGPISPYDLEVIPSLSMTKTAWV